MDSSISHLRLTLANFNNDYRALVNNNDSEDSLILKNKIHDSNVLTEEIECILGEIEKCKICIKDGRVSKNLKFKDNELLNEEHIQEEAIIKGNHVLKLTIDDAEKIIEQQNHIKENLKEFDELQNRLREEMKRNVELNHKSDLMESDIEDLKKLRHFYNQFPLNEPTLDDNSYQMKIYYKNKLFEILNGINIEKVPNTQDWRVVFNHLREEFEGLDASSTQLSKRRKMIKEASNLITSVHNANTILQDYDKHLRRSIIKSEVNEAGKHFGIDFDQETYILMIISKKFNAKVQLPAYYPFEGTSKIKIIALSGFKDAQSLCSSVNRDFNSLVEWIKNLIEVVSGEKQ